MLILLTLSECFKGFASKPRLFGSVLIFQDSYFENLEEMIAAQKEARSRREEEFMSLKTDMAKLSERNKVLSESNQTLTENNVELNNLKQKLLETGMDKQNAERHNKDLLDQVPI